MPPTRTLRGGCQCGRNVYIVEPPPDTTEPALLLFDPAPSHRVSLASPLPTFLRVPLAWYHSQTQPFSASETPILINRTYEHQPSEQSTRRNFCGYCGTPLSFWSEGPHPEADYIRLALGSLNIEDLEELDDWVEDLQSSGSGSEEGQDDKNKDENNTSKKKATGGPTGIPWFDSFVEGSRLGRHLEQQQQQRERERESRALEQTQSKTAKVHRHETGQADSADGRVHVEWEVLEWTEGDDGDEVKSSHSQPSPAKRARLGEDDGDTPESVSMD